MNKYQEALDYMGANAIQEVTNSYFRRHDELDGISYKEFDTHRKALQELVEKSMLMKPKKVGHYSSDEWCPNCRSFNIETRDEERKNQKWEYCPDCGQALDWSQDENN